MWSQDSKVLGRDSISSTILGSKTYPQCDILSADETFMIILIYHFIELNEERCNIKMLKVQVKRSEQILGCPLFFS